MVVLDMLINSQSELTKWQTFDNYHKGTFSFDGKLLTLMGRNSVEIIEVSSGRRIIQFAPSQATMLGARFSPDGHFLATAEKQFENSQTIPFKVTIWDIATGKEKLSLPIVNDQWYRVIDDLSFSPDGELLASNLGGIARIWKTSDGSEVKRFLPPDEKQPVQSERVLMSPNGQWLAVYFKNQKMSVDFIRVWDLSTQKRIDLATNVYQDWTFSADSRFLAVTAIQRKGHADEHSAVEIWDLSDGKRTQIIEVPDKWRGAFTVAFAPDNSMVAIGGYKKFGLFSFQTGQLLAEGQHPKNRFFQDSELPYELSDIEFSPDGNLLLTGGNDGTVKLWKIAK
ncbi:MAG TPA: hypothetical protein PKY82_00465 [Pyrinomonadaceae bacterium]|nr:hypothetical protein [Pyrinomonadaceae bacterium]